jgi:hypothetical protein
MIGIRAKNKNRPYEVKNKRINKMKTVFLHAASFGM